MTAQSKLTPNILLVDVAYECRMLNRRVGLYPEHILSSVSGRSLYERKVGTRRHLCINSV